MKKIANSTALVADGKESGKLKINHKALAGGLIGSIFTVFIIMPFGVYPLVKQDRHPVIDININNYKYAVNERNLYVWDAVVFHGQFTDLAKAIHK